MTALDSPRSLAKRQQMLAAARQLCLTQGYARTSTDAIARSAGVSKQTLYVYFAGKAELLTAVITAELGGLEAPPGERGHASATLDDLRTHLFGFAQSVTGRLLQPDAIALLRLVVGEAVHLPELRGVLRQALPARLLATVEALLTVCAARGLIAAPDPDLSARMLVGPIMSFVALDGLFGDVVPDPPPASKLHALIGLFLLTVSAERKDR